MSDRRRKNAPALSDRCASVANVERRSAPRYASQGTAAFIGWSDGDDQRTIPATLIDISMGGFSAWVDSYPPRGVPVWLRLDGASCSPWLKANVVATGRSGYLFWSRRRVRLRFLEPCPYDFFKEAIQGFTREVNYLDQTFEGANRRYWR